MSDLELDEIIEEIIPAEWQVSLFRQAGKWCGSATTVIGAREHKVTAGYKKNEEFDTPEDLMRELAAQISL